MKTGIAAGGVAGAAVVVIGKTGLQALQIGTPAAASTTDPFAARQVTLNVNGANYTVQVEPRDMLVDVLREGLGLIATKRPCNRMECGGCMILINNVAHYACQYPAILAGGGQAILTAEAGAGKNPDPVVSALVQAWAANDASQCAYCSPGMIMAATALLKSNTNPTVDEIKSALSGNLCRCGAYLNIIEAVQQAASSLSGSGA